ncbi:ABC transporter substrate-binding protein [Candidatus Hydrogenedentota bacterium]
MAAWIRDFPLGKAPLVMIVLFLVSATPIGLRTTLASSSDTELVFWVFAPPHYDEYEAKIPKFEAENPGVRVKLKKVFYEVLHDKLQSAFLSGYGAPDMVEIEFGQAGRFFKGRIQDIGFIDLKPLLERDGLREEFVEARLKFWSNRGRYYGLPHDLHPSVLMYQKHLFDEAGVDIDKIETWGDFVVEGRKLVKDKDGDGKTDQFAMMLGERVWNFYWMLLQQRHAGMFDEAGNVTIDSDIAVDVLEKYCALLNEGICAGNLGNDFTKSPNFAAYREGYFAAVIAPDWYIGFMKKHVPDMAGKWRARPLPIFEPGDATTASLGGTMLGITKNCEHPKLAWKFAKYAYFDTESLAKRFETTTILPPVKSSWSHEIFSNPDPYFGGQVSGQLLIEQAEQLPDLFLSAYFPEAVEKFGDTIIAALRGDKEPREALEFLADHIRTIIDEDPFNAMTLGVEDQAETLESKTEK